MRALGVVLVAMLVAVAALIAAATHGSSASAAAPTVSPPFTTADLDAQAADNWLTAGGGLHDNRFSSLTDINTGNATGLTQAWQAHMGLSAKLQAATSEEASPIAYNGVLYVPDGQSNVYAYNGATGALLWKHDAALESKPFITAVRGLAIGDGKIYAPQGDGYITALDETNGNVVWKTRLGISTEGYSFTSPAVYYQGMILEGASGGDAGGRSFVVALDAKTGLELWRWYVAPAPGEIGSGSWPANNEWQHGGGAIWISPSVDPDSNLLYVVTGNPVPWNGRGPGDDLWTDSIVALHVQNGQFAWGFQTVHHDIWDYDVTNPPVLFDAMYSGVMRKGIAVASKTGWVYILDRENGKPLLGIPEKKVPQIKGAGKNYANLAKTQPHPVGDAFVNQCAKKSWFPGNAPDGKPYTIGCIFTPYTVSPKGNYGAWAPSAEGGVDWPPSAYSPTTNLMYVCAREGSASIGAIPKNQQQLIAGSLYVGVNFSSSKVHKDTGAVVAMNMGTNKIAWKVPWPKPCFSGMLATAGNLVFVGNDQKLTAYDATSGNLVWSSPQLASGASAPAITYRVNGKQYVAIVAGGATLGPTKAGDSIYAFALPG
jgi:PQQ-dependent dehydrogenase (methanol/ethanol family)